MFFDGLLASVACLTGGAYGAAFRERGDLKEKMLPKEVAAAQQRMKQLRALIDAKLKSSGK